MESEDHFLFRYFLIMGGAVPAAIIWFNCLIFLKVIPEQATMDYIVLSSQGIPPLSSLFLTNFVHANLSHLLENMGSYLVILAFIGATIRFVIPFFNNNTSPVIFCEKTLVDSSILFLTVVPFIISAESVILLFFTTTAKSAVGFSGVGYAFEGYLIYLTESMIFWKLVHPSIVKKRIIFVLVSIGLLMVLPVYVVLTQFSEAILMGNIMTNYGAHVTGFVLGILIPYGLDRKRIGVELGSELR